MDLSAEIIGSVESVTKKWAKQRKAEERRASSCHRREAALEGSWRETAKDVAWEGIESAYMKASAQNTLPAHARQIMYAARGKIQERTGKPLNDQYFIQTLLPDYMNANSATAKWNVVFDARGHFEEPHTKLIVPLGTIEVREYLLGADVDVVDEPGCLGDASRFPTTGPDLRFGAVLFIEKEGFLPLFRKVKLAERYDIAIMSTKGMSVVASRKLIDALCTTDYGIPLYVLHDFDKAGFSIAGTLKRDTRRYEFENSVDVTDIGLRLPDIEKYELQSEDVSYGKSDPTWNLRKNGATDEEIAFLRDGESGWGGYNGRRVELNALSSDDLVEWIEGKLKEHGVKKVVPDHEHLETAYRRALEIKELERELEVVRESVRERVQGAKVPEGLKRKVQTMLKKEPDLSWDRAVAEIVREKRGSSA